VPASAAGTTGAKLPSAVTSIAACGMRERRVQVVVAAVQVDMDLEGLPQRVNQFAIGSQRSGKTTDHQICRLRRTLTGIADQ
jgi:hypothetical protein